MRSVRSVGVLLALGTALISGLSVYVNAFGVRLVPDPAVYTTLKNGVAAAILLVGAFALTGVRAEIRTLRPRDLGGLLAIGVIGGSVPFLLFFTGLAQASAPTAAFIHKTLFVWVALLAAPLLGERLGWLQVVALGGLAVAQLLVAPPTGVVWGTGETLIALATACWTIEVVIAKRLLAVRSAELVAIGRMGLGVVLLAGYVLLTGRAGVVGQVPAEGWSWVLVTGGLLAGYVATWYAALRRAPATVVTSILVLAAPVTGALQAASKGSAPDAAVLAGYALIAGVVALVAIVASRAGRADPATIRQVPMSA